MATVDFLQHFPYGTPRDIQTRTLEILSREWAHYDVFVIQAPTAYGKTAISRTLMSALGSVAVVTPTNLLVEQFLAEFPETDSLRRLDSYHCTEWDRPCSVTRGKLLAFCKRSPDRPGGCPCGTAMAIAKYRGGPVLSNYHVHLAQKLHRDVLVVDEAHNLLALLRDRLSQKIWQHDYGYPSNAYSTEQIRDWVRTLPERQRKHKKIRLLWEAVTHPAPDWVVQRATESFAGKGTRRGEPEDRDCLKLLPVDISGAPPIFWPGLGSRTAAPGKVRKVVLLSATIGRKDIEALGLGRRARVLYVSCESPIPAERRPVVVDPVATISRGNLEESAALVARHIQEVLAPRFPGKKGLVHATYQMAQLLRAHLAGDPRYLFHGREDKREVYDLFRAAPADSGVVLVASGLYEGIDLPYDAGRWQVLSKVPWQSLGSPAVKYMAEADPEWYYWETLRTVMQACGRICRTPEDRGYTFILDGTFERLYDKTHDLRPVWFTEALLNPGEEVYDV